MSQQIQTEDKLNFLLQNMRDLNEISENLLMEMKRKNQIMDVSLYSCKSCNALIGGQYDKSYKKNNDWDDDYERDQSRS